MPASQKVGKLFSNNLEFATFQIKFDFVKCFQKGLSCYCKNDFVQQNPIDKNQILTKICKKKETCQKMTEIFGRYD